MPTDGKGAKGGDVMTKTHAAGAGMQYGMRYLLKGIFNVAIGEEDKDGNDPPKLPAADFERFKKAIEQRPRRYERDSGPRASIRTRRRRS
jgi:hypothetical protein